MSIQYEDFRDIDEGTRDARTKQIRRRMAARVVELLEGEFGVVEGRRLAQVLSDGEPVHKLGAGRSTSTRYSRGCERLVRIRKLIEEDPIMQMLQSQEGK